MGQEDSINQYMAINILLLSRAGRILRLQECSAAILLSWQCGVVVQRTGPLQPDAEVPYTPSDVLFKYLRFTSTPMNYTQAQRVCASHRGHITSVLSASEEMQLQAVLGANTRSFWVGLDALRSPSTAALELTWLDGSELSYSNFTSVQVPSPTVAASCTLLQPVEGNRAWTLDSCSLLRPFACMGE